MSEYTMRFWCKVTCASLFGLSLTMLVIHWELENADVHWQWNGDFYPGTTRPKENVGSRKQKEKRVHSEPVQKKKNLNTGETTGYFRRLIKDTYIYSAFYESQKDDEESFIRLIILSGKYYQPKLICHFCNSSEADCACPPQIALLYTNNENHDRKYGGFIATCVIPQCFKKDSSYVYVSAEDKSEVSEKVRLPLVSTVHKSFLYNYGVCIPPLRGQGLQSLHRLVEFIELTRILGAEHFTFYDLNIDDHFKKALCYYQEQGVVTVQPWNLPDDITSNGQNIWYHGQVLAIQDCLYRGKGKVKFVSFNDIDEFIVPLGHSTVPLFLDSIHSDAYCGHCFDSVIFSLNARIPKLNKKSNLLSQLVFYRTSDKLSSRSKCIVDPLQVFEMGIHHISKARRKELTVNKVDEKIGLVFHYRTCSSAYGIGKACGNLIADYTMQPFAKVLQKNVDTVLKNLVSNLKYK